MKQGQGRHAVRVLDEAFEYESTTVAVTAASEVISAEVEEKELLGKYITAMKLWVGELENTGNALPGLFVLEMVRKATLDLRDARVQAAIAEFEAKKKSEQTARALLDSLFRVYTSWRRHPAAKTKLAAALKAAIAKRRKNTPNGRQLLQLLWMSTPTVTHFVITVGDQTTSGHSVASVWLIRKNT